MLDFLGNKILKKKHIYERISSMRVLHQSPNHAGLCTMLEGQDSWTQIIVRKNNSFSLSLIFSSHHPPRPVESPWLALGYRKGWKGREEKKKKNSTSGHGDRGKKQAAVLLNNGKKKLASKLTHGHLSQACTVVGGGSATAAST